MPPVGNGLVLTSDQIRYCVYEDRRIKGAEKAVDSYNQASVNSFNTMVEDYNSRCGHFRYRDGTLAPIEDEANAIQRQLEQEGQARMTGGQAEEIATPTPTASTDTPASISTISDGPAALTKEQSTMASDGAQQYDPAVGREVAPNDREDLENLRTCLSGSYPMLCKHGRLTTEQADLVERAELNKNYEACVSGEYPTLCKHEKLTPDQAVRVEQAELDANYKICISGDYPTLCKHNLLTSEQAEAVAAAERR